MCKFIFEVYAGFSIFPAYFQKYHFACIKSNALQKGLNDAVVRGVHNGNRENTAR
jgi:hypothetical protein